MTDFDALVQHADDVDESLRALCHGTFSPVSAVDAVDVLQELLEAHATGDTTRMAEIRAQLTPGEIDAVVATAVGELVDHALAEIATKTGLEGSP